MAARDPNAAWRVAATSALVNAAISTLAGIIWFGGTGGEPLRRVAGIIGSLIPATLLSAFLMTIALTLATARARDVAPPSVGVLLRRASATALGALLLVPLGVILVEGCIASGIELTRFALSQALYGAIVGAVLAPIVVAHAAPPATLPRPQRKDRR